MADDLFEHENPEFWEPSEQDIINWNEANDYIHEGEENSDEEEYDNGN